MARLAILSRRHVDSPAETFGGSRTDTRWIAIASRSGKLNIAVLPGRSLKMGNQCKIIGTFTTRKMSHRKADPLSKKRPTVTDSQRNYSVVFF